MQILYFASFRERLQTDSERWDDLSGIHTLEDLLDALRDRGEPWQSTLDPEKTLAAINQEMAPLNSSISPDDEIAFFPPVTGG